MLSIVVEADIVQEIYSDAMMTKFSTRHPQAPWKLFKQRTEGDKFDS